MEHLCTAFDETFINNDELKAGQEKCEIVFKLINGYISYLDKAKKSQSVQK